MATRERLSAILVQLAVLHAERHGQPVGALAAIRLLRERRDAEALRALRASPMPAIAGMASDLECMLVREGRAGCGDRRPPAPSARRRSDGRAPAPSR